MPSRQSRRLDKLTEKIPLDARIQMWIQAVTDATPDGVSWRDADDEHRKWLGEIENTVPQDDWNRWEEQRLELLSIYGTAEHYLDGIQRRFITAMMRLAVLDMAVWLRETDQGEELERRMGAVLAGEDPGPATSAGNSEERLRGLATLLHVGTWWSSDEAFDLWVQQCMAGLTNSDHLHGSVVVRHTMTAPPEENKGRLVAAARFLLNHAADFKAACAIIQEALVKLGQGTLLPRWQSAREIVDALVTALRESHSAFQGTYTPLMNATEVAALREALKFRCDSPWGFRNVLAYYEWLHMDPPLHPSQQNRAEWETSRFGERYRPRPKWEEHLREQEEKAERERETKQGRQRGDLDTQR